MNYATTYIKVIPARRRGAFVDGEAEFQDGRVDGEVCHAETFAVGQLVIEHHEGLVVESLVHGAEVDAQVHVLSAAVHHDVRVFWNKRM